MNFLRNLSKKEWALIATCSAMLIFLSSIGYIYAWLKTPDGMFYNGIHAITPGDIPVYLSYINEIKSGSWLIHNRMTGEIDLGIFNLAWFIPGLVARMFSLSPLLAFHIVRVLLIPIFCLVSYYAISNFTANEKVKKLSLYLFCFASGVGSIFAPIIEVLNPEAFKNVDTWPIDLWVPEATAFISLNNSPHMILTWIGLMLMLTFFYKSTELNSFKYAIYSGLVGLFWFSFHPFYFPLIFLIALLYSSFLYFKEKQLRYFLPLVISFLIYLPVVIYHYFVIATDPIDNAKALQNILITPPFYYFVMGYGVLLVFATIFVWKKFIEERAFNNTHVFLFIASVSCILASYAPIFFQRRLMLGLSLTLAILSASYVVDLWSVVSIKKSKYLKPTVAALLFLLLFQSNIFHVIRELSVVKTHHDLIYSSIGLIKSAEFLDTQETKVILSDIYTSMHIPTHSLQRVFIGHGVETVDYLNKGRLVSRFFRNELSTFDLANFTEKYNISHLVTGHYDFEPDPQLFSKIFEFNGYKVYVVVSD